MQFQPQKLRGVRDRLSDLRRPLANAARALLRDWLARGSLLAVTALGCVLILVNSLIAYRSVQTLVAQQHILVQTHAVETALEELSASLNDAETGEQRYILTSDESALAPYAAAIAQIPREVDQLTAMVERDAAQRLRMEALKPLIADHLAELQATIDLKREGREQTPRNLLTIESKETTETIHQVLADMVADEQELLLEQNRVAQASTNATYTALALSTLADLVLLIAIVYLARRALVRREQVAQERAELLAHERTARREAEMAVRMRDEFLSIASHELRNPLTVLLGSAQVLQRRLAREGGMSPRSLHALEVIPQQATRLRALIEAMLDVTRIEHGQLTLASGPLDLAGVVLRVVEEARATTERHVLNCEGTGLPVYVAGDAVRLEQVLHNLVENAIKYSPRGGEIHVRLTVRDEHAEVAVRDEGIGIPATALARLFERFFRAPNASAQRISGTGIGLYVIREIITLHGGTIDVVSTEGRGSTFTVSLPKLATLSEVDGTLPRNGVEQTASPLQSAPARRRGRRRAQPRRPRR
jgi:signal transduction histidine kinase